jgi:hypothetical protein
MIGSAAVECMTLYYYLQSLHGNTYEGGPKSNRNRPVAHACFLVTSCAAR